MTATTPGYIERESSELIEAFRRHDLVSADAVERAERLHDDDRVREAVEVLLAARHEADDPVGYDAGSRAPPSA